MQQVLLQSHWNALESWSHSEAFHLGFVVMLQMECFLLHRSITFMLSATGALWSAQTQEGWSSPMAHCVALDSCVLVVFFSKPYKTIAQQKIKSSKRLSLTGVGQASSEIKQSFAWLSSPKLSFCAWITLNILGIKAAIPAALTQWHAGGVLVTLTPWWAALGVRRNVGLMMYNVGGGIRHLATAKKRQVMTSKKWEAFSKGTGNAGNG